MKKQLIFALACLSFGACLEACELCKNNSCEGTSCVIGRRQIQNGFEGKTDKGFLKGPDGMSRSLRNLTTKARNNRGKCSTVCIEATLKKLERIKADYIANCMELNKIHKNTLRTAPITVLT